VLFAYFAATRLAAGVATGSLDRLYLIALLALKRRRMRE
jgi:hypothetical protein